LPSFAFWSTQKNRGLVKFEFKFKFGAHENSSTRNLEHYNWQGSGMAQLLLDYLVTDAMSGNSLLQVGELRYSRPKLILKLTAILR
jgi:hypothetical protein